MRNRSDQDYRFKIGPRRLAGGFLVVLFLIFFPHIILAQEEQPLVEPVEALIVEAGEDMGTAVGWEVDFKVSSLTGVVEGQELLYSWDLGDGVKKTGSRISHSYERSGEYIVKLEISDGQRRAFDQIKVSVFEEVVLLVADNSPGEDDINALKRQASKEGVLLVVIRDARSEADYLIEGALEKSLLENKAAVKESRVIMTWTTGSLGLNVLSKFAQDVEDLREFDFGNKAVIAITDKNFSAIARIAQSTFDLLRPEYVLLTKSSAIPVVIEVRDPLLLVGEVRNAGVENVLIGIHSERAVKDLGVTNFLSYTVNYLVNRGVQTENIFLLLMIPVIATLVALARQVFGIKTFGIYIPTIITLTFLATGIKYGLTIFIVILLAATLMRFVLRRFKLLYLPRMAIVLTVVALVMLALFVIGSMTQRTGIIALSIFPMLILTILVEKFVEVQIEKGFVQAVWLSLGTILVSIVCYYFVNWDSFKILILGYPELILLTLVINILLGKWVGLRISEYLRFRWVRGVAKEESKS